MSEAVVAVAVVVAAAIEELDAVVANVYEAYAV